MNFFYLDDSKHPDAGFCVGAFVAAQEDPTSAIERILEQNGMTPYVEEFKSSLRMDSSGRNREIREGLRQLLQSCRLGIVIAKDESSLAKHSTYLLQKMLSHPIFADKPAKIITDQDIFRHQADREFIQNCDWAQKCTFLFEQDSKLQLGIQLADVAAHTCALMMKDSLGLIKKTLPAGNNSGYDPDLQIELGFLMFASLRYSFLGESPEVTDWSTARQVDFARTLTRRFGLVIDPHLPEHLRKEAESRFGSIYVGCVH